MSMKNDINGKESSKRFWAGKFLAVGLVMAMAYFAVEIVFAITSKPMTMQFPFEMWYGLIGGGWTAIGLTLFEKKIK